MHVTKNDVKLCCLQHVNTYKFCPKVFTNKFDIPIPQISQYLRYLEIFSWAK